VKIRINRSCPLFICENIQVLLIILGKTVPLQAAKDIKNKPGFIIDI
jgi:hypothetical protein